ncbi:AI-2E family transporter [Nostoc sp. NZL]|uniref:AI-2E family transporter n=1 Tax=Nostoc sp. NZL TaxID=2650612 RepID=UPI0018C4E79D|nr:AI-2E family transporter [Nostoc sp. NZL]MBG1239892.1 AI-2E family transporter [Nostoc sp. NZL]
MKLGQYLGLLGLIVSLYIFWQIRQLVLLLFTAVVLAVAINQLVLWFQQFGIKRIWAVWLSVSIVITLLVGVFFLIVPPFIQQFRELIVLLPTGIDQIQRAINWLEKRILEIYLPEIPDINNFIEQLQPWATNLLQQAIALFSTSVNAILELLLVIVLTLMLLANPRPYRRAFVRLFPAFYRWRVKEILSLCAEGLGGWTIGALIEMVFIGLLSGLGLWILQVPLVLAHAVLAGLLNFIPNIGPTLSVVLPMAIAFLDAPWKVGAVIILYIVIQNIESYWLTPTVMARQAALLPAVTLTAQIVFVTLFGALGLLMAIPLAVVTKTWIEEVLFKDILDQWQ